MGYRADAMLVRKAVSLEEFQFFNWPEFTRKFLAEFSRRTGRRMSYFGGRKRGAAITCW